MLAIVKLLGGWRATLFAVLAVAAIVACLFLRGAATHAGLRADAAEQRAEAAEADAQALRGALARDAVAQSQTDLAIARMDAAAEETNQRLSNLERRIHGRPPVPAVCPDPDPVLVRELAEGAGRFRATGSELRRLRAAEDSAAD